MTSTVHASGNSCNVDNTTFTYSGYVYKCF